MSEALPKRRGAPVAGHRPRDIAGWGTGAAQALSALAPRLSAWREEETGRRLLWAPVYLAAGVALYFAFPAEPNLGVVLGIVGAGGLGLCALSRRGQAGESAVAAAFAVLLVATGVLLGTVRTASVAAPVLSRPIGPAPNTGVLIEREDRTGDQRYTLAVEAIGVLPTGDLPARIRVTWRGGPAEDLAPGDRLSLYGQLYPPPGPALPGGFDFGRQLYYDRIGATGFLYAVPERIEPGAAAGPARIIRRWRAAIAGRVERLTPGMGAPVAAALVTGERDAIPPEITAALRDTGLAHLLAISGLHMGLVCGFLFAAVRFLLACHEGLAARRPIRRWAAVIALLGGTVYLALSGGSVSAQRAYIMAAIGFAAILLDRRAISLRNVALAALVIIVLSPEEVVSAGFQMSFAAVTALVATYDAVRRWRRDHPPRSVSGGGGPGPLRRGAVFFGALLLTSLVAGLATAPMAIHHFGRFAGHGLLANMAVMPLFSLVVMPGAVLGLILMPLGLDAPLWIAVGQTLDLLLRMTLWFASWEGAVTTVPAGHSAGFVLGLLGLFLLCLLTAPWRLGGLAVMALGAVVFAAKEPPALYIARDLKNVGVPLETPPAAAADDDGAGVAVLSRRRSRFEGRQWQRALGHDEYTRPARRDDCEDGRALCTLTTTVAGAVIWAPDVETAAAACRRAALVIAPVWEEPPLRRSCGARLITARDGEVMGAMTVAEEGRQLAVEGAAMARENRPWGGAW